jgi:hypothetical protein
MTVSIKSLARERTSPSEWTVRIAGAWTQAAAAVLETGKLLNEAKRALPHGEFARMLQSSDLPFSERTAQRLMAIARHPILSNPTHVSLLPPAWSTLSALCQLPGDTLRLKFESGAVHPGLQRGQVREWRETQTGQDVRDGLPEGGTPDDPKLDQDDNLLVDTAAPTERPSPGLRQVVTGVKGMVDLNTASKRDHFGILCAVWDATSADVREQFLTRIEAEPVYHSPRSKSRPASAR